ncbi:MAG: DUF3626 domain-containing protein [Granulosicoccus sp.]
MNNFSDVNSLDDPLITRVMACVNDQSDGTPLTSDHSITLNFHPDIMQGGVSVISQLLSDSLYRSQFETGTSSGSLSSHVGGKRWNWESRLFCGLYDCAPSSKRPKYGALNYKKCLAGGAPRFGSAYLRLKSHVLCQTTFAYPDSHYESVDLGTQTRMGLISLADANEAGLDDSLDNYVEAHVHGPVHVERDVDSLVLDPSFRNSPIESVAQQLPCNVEWHGGFRLESSHYEQCLGFRGKETADFVNYLSGKGVITPATLSPYRDGSVDEQIIKKVWHCLVKFGAA